MQFETDAHKACYEKIRPMLKELFGEMLMEREDRPSFALPHGSTMVQVAIFPWGKDDATIGVRAYVVMGAELTPELLLFLLEKNSQLRFGAFGIDSDKDIFFEHTICGLTCDKAEIRASIMAVAITADKFDDEIIARWGGQTAIGRMTNRP